MYAIRSYYALDDDVSEEPPLIEADGLAADDGVDATADLAPVAADPAAQLGDGAAEFAGEDIQQCFLLRNNFV